MQRGTEALRERLPAHPSSVGTARRALRRVTGHRLPEEIVDTAELLVSELVTNAVVHAGTPIELEVALVDPGTVVVQVTDGSVHRPVARPYDESSGTGRGLLLVEELSDQWGVSEAPHGKTVWFCLAVEPTQASTPPGVRPSTEGAPGVAPDAVEVQLHHVPLLLHAQWQLHASALLREFLLVSLDGGDELDQMVRHAACSDALALLESAVPTPGPEDTDTLEHEVWHSRMTLCVPKESVSHFAVLDETLDRAVDLADSDATLTPTTSPAMREFRRWVCTQVLEQAQGLPATPWQGS